MTTNDQMKTTDIILIIKLQGCEGVDKYTTLLSCQELWEGQYHWVRLGVRFGDKMLGVRVRVKVTVTFDGDLRLTLSIIIKCIY